MSDRAKRLLWAAALLVLAIGVALTVQTAGALDGTAERMARKWKDLERLRAIQASLLRCDMARAAAEKEGARRAEALLPVVQAEFPGVKAEDCRESRREAAPGWNVRQTEVTFGDVAFGGVMDFVGKAGSMKPPWRLAKCTFRVSPGGAGTGQAVIMLEALEKRE